MRSVILGYMFGFNRKKGKWEIRMLEQVAPGAGDATSIDGKNNLRTHHVAFGTKDFCHHECQRLNKEMQINTLQ